MLLGTTVLLLLLGSAGQASAHAALRGADPADGAVLKTAPRSITLTFTESVGLIDDTFRVFDPGNGRVETGEAQHVDGRSDTARVTLPAKLGTGTFTVAWRVVSADSHPIAGAFTFSVGAPSATLATVPSGPVEDPAVAGLHKLGRYLAYGAAALLIGTAAFVALCRPPDVRPLRGLLMAGWWTFTASTVLLLLLRAPYETGAGPAQALDPSGLARTLAGRPGIALAARLLLLAAAAALLLRQRGRVRPTRATAVTGTALAVGLALTWAAAEHASAGIQVPAAMASSVLHLLAMAVWLGGLTALLTLLRLGTLPAAVAARFSRLATLSVTVLAVTGVYQAWRGLGTLDALTETTYGRTLLAKLAAVGLLLLAGAWSRQWTGRLVRTGTDHAQVTDETDETDETDVTDEEEAEMPENQLVVKVAAAVGVSAKEGVAAKEGMAARTPEDAPSPPVENRSADGPPLTPAEHAHRRALRRSVLAEVVVSVVVLGLTTVLTGTLPGRAQAEAATAEQSVGLPVASVTTVPFDMSSAGAPGARGTVQITLDPGRVGENSVQAVVYGPDGGFATVPELRLSFSLPGQDIGPLDAKITDRSGYWAAEAVNLPLPGTWEMSVTVRASEIDQVTETKTVRITR
ncbi:copper resistance protein CopC [Streptomyces sp. ID05-39B]|uniref:copper resistance CopC/CopD family protein n=1 Tax=Streptomyces sp. ID05-39B TaxID=3028664 RepID=UPI0029A483CC|nr:copper resistance protein CopC [Streptomyces sp. ID05-39B]MDX3531735.1 copper resistance protein CopC [Streptomyces sp. ID05-39B]